MGYTFSQKMNKWICFSILTNWNLKSKFKFQVFPSRQDRKTKSFVYFLGEFTARQFCFEIFWPLRELFFEIWTDFYVLTWKKQTFNLNSFFFFFESWILCRNIGGLSWFPTALLLGEEPYTRDIHIECSKQFKWNSYFHMSGQSRPFWAALKLL